MLNKLMKLMGTFMMTASWLPDYLDLHFVGNSVFFFGEPEYPLEDK